MEVHMPYTFTLTSIIPATPQQIYEAWLDSIAHSEMTGGEANMSDEIGAEVSAWDGYITGSNLELVPGERIVQAWRTSEFADEHDNSIVTVMLESVEEGTLLTLVHSNVPDSHRSYEEGGWESQYFEPMKAYFAKLEVEEAADDEEPESEAASDEESEESAPESAPVYLKTETMAPAPKKPRKAKAKQAVSPPADAGSATKTKTKRAAAAKGRRKAGRPSAKKAAGRAAPKRAAPKRAAARKATTRKATPKRAAKKTAKKAAKKTAAKRTVTKSKARRRNAGRR